MSEPFIGEIRAWAAAYAPKGWALCAGQLLPINQNQALFSLLGTAFGGDGIRTFGLPDLRGRAPLGQDDATYPLGNVGGEASHTLTVDEMPAHTHLLQANNTQDAKNNLATPSPTSVLGKSVEPGGQGGTDKPFQPYAPALTTPVVLHPSTMATTGGNQPHENRQPYLGVNICIALQGIFPSRS